MAVQLMPRDIQRLQKAMAQVRDELFFRSFRNLLRARLSFDTFLILIFPKDGAPEPLETWIKDPVLAHNYPRLYTAGAYRLDPFFQYRNQIGDGGLYLLSRDCPGPFLCGGEYYLQYYKQTKIIGEVGLLVPLSDGSVGHLSFSRREGRGTFKRKEVNCLKQASPILLELLRQHCEHRMALRITQGPDNTSRPLEDLIRAHVAESQKPQFDAARGVRLAGLILQGHSNLSAALSLGISRETAKVHRRNIYRKLQISSQTELFVLLADLF